MSRYPALLGVILLFGLLAAGAALNFPQGIYDGEMTRRVHVLHFLVHTIATDNFGQIGGAVFYAVLGVVAAGLVIVATREPTIETDTSVQPERTAPARIKPINQKGTPEAAATKTKRQRALVMDESVPAKSNAEALIPPDQDAPKAEWDKWADALIKSPSLPPMAADPATEPTPAWGLILASPWEDVSKLRSWLGGIPCAPKGFEWPRDEDDGEPMHFYAQINLADLKPEPETGARPPGLPEEGALLVFIGAQSAVRVLSADEIENSHPVPPPDDLPSLRKFEYWTDEKTFPAWPIKPQAFLDHPIDEDVFWEEMDGEAVPEAFRRPSTELTDWMTNWGIAAFEVDRVIESLKTATSLAQSSLDYKVRTLTREAEASDGPMPDEEVIHAQAFDTIGDHDARILKDGSGLLEVLEEWKSHAEAQDPVAAIDADMFADFFDTRREFCKGLKLSALTENLREPNGNDMWGLISQNYRQAGGFSAMRDMPEAYRDFADEVITCWRRHRLFGVEPPFSNNMDDLRGKACLISIGADPLIKTQTEHEYGISLWVPIEDLNAGHFDDLQIVRHCAV